MTSLSKKQILQHLSLALEQDEEELRRRVEILVNIHTRRKIRKAPGVPFYPITWEHRVVKRTTSGFVVEEWQCKLHQLDAKFVEEVWADYRMRKEIPGSWKTFTKDDKIAPLYKHGDILIFKFVSVPPEIIQRKKESQAKKVDSIIADSANLSLADLEDMLVKLTATA